MITIKICGKEYHIRGEIDPDHLARVASHVDTVLRDIQRSTPDTQDAAILTALNICSELFQLRDGGLAVETPRIQALIDLIDSA